MSIAYTNARLFTGHAIETNKAVLTQNNIIVDVVPATEVPSHYTVHDLQGHHLAPAFIDLQIYGGNGKLFSHEISVASLQATYEYCLAGGCTHFMITMATNTIEKFLQGMEVVKLYWEQGGKGLLGLHLEGPYMNPVKRGAHLLDCIKQPTLEEVKLLLERGAAIFKMITLAPEQCDPAIIALLLQHNIIVSAGHSNATYQQAMGAFDLGIPAATHLFNAMSPLQHREPGMVGAIFNHPAVVSSLVCDGIHVDYAAVKIAKSVMKERLFFITDAVAETTTGEYQHLFKGDRYTLPDGTLSGSALTMMQCVKNAVEHVNIPLEEALRMASTYPAQLLRGKKAGLIAKGYEAYMVVFDDALKVQQVIQ
ncbi:N-acetylglucosamine-6-phosphate deacetylase [Pseudoflavitalea sp. X16]|uniref:N-acetylglucosamine-6-phosphate deacetylase n=1 Tax=Paraflavitalea devenefica TaxID=2716334 RepID=UPI00142012B3|nr:N-acetylglucosamine-6-phosphate deacetylase [Paraflavitalea devenefica]NII24492.1 N-acetylglucosamine-6-phosphate deacetylase [Paraflavitalea devenefica]